MLHAEAFTNLFGYTPQLQMSFDTVYSRDSYEPLQKGLALSTLTWETTYMLGNKLPFAYEVNTNTS